MKDPQTLRDEARGFLDKANDTSDKAVRKVLLERALRLVQQAGMIEYASSTDADPHELVIEDAPQGSPHHAMGGRRD
ncbi:MAG: hypothetical protein ACREDY_17070 [Bradyrhizobium sp.]